LVKHELVGETRTFTKESEKLILGPFKGVEGSHEYAVYGWAKYDTNAEHLSNIF
jgi:hypothetical protein